MPHALARLDRLPRPRREGLALHEREGEGADLEVSSRELAGAEGEEQRAGRVFLPRAVGEQREGRPADARGPSARAAREQA